MTEFLTKPPGGDATGPEMTVSFAANSLSSVKLLNLDHVAIAVHDLDAALAGYRSRYNVEPLYRETIEEQGVEEAMIPVGGSFVQLLQPLGPETSVGKFLSKNGEGLHHVAYAVASIDKALEHLEADGARLIDREPRSGGRGTRIAFVHPGDLGGTLIELVELGDG
jgi:methylmalonyl-CoA/ethylmalonyl-CoA epimerase